jgi:hypothetical protein
MGSANPSPYLTFRTDHKVVGGFGCKMKTHIGQRYSVHRKISLE